ncbi:phosphate-starvation-inducible PsiE family protein [Stetteria hydrogenophila]
MTGGDNGLSMERLVRYFMATLEVIVALVLAAGVIVATAKIAVNLKELLLAKGFDKEVFLSIIDNVLLVILAIDLTRTLITAIVEQLIPIRTTIEAAILAVLREFIAVEIRHPSISLLLTLTLVFAVATAAWIAIGFSERHGYGHVIVRLHRGEGEKAKHEGRE